MRVAIKAGTGEKKGSCPGLVTEGLPGHLLTVCHWPALSTLHCPSSRLTQAHGSPARVLARKSTSSARELVCVFARK